MEILEGAMAFAVAMIIFSTMATGIVEVFLRFSHTKPRLLAESIRKMLDRIVVARMPEYLETVVGDDGRIPNGTLAASDRRKLDEMCNALTENPAAKPLPDAPRTLRDRVWYDWADRKGNRFRVDALSSFAFAKRLSESDLGEHIARKITSEVGRGDAALMAAKLSAELQEWQIVYERYRATANEQFRKYAQFLTVLIAIAMAVTFNIHAGRLFMGVMDNEGAQLREQLIASAEDRKSAYDAAELKLQQTIKALNEAATSGGQPDAAITADLAQQIAQMQAIVAGDDATALMPVGSAYFPHCMYTGFFRAVPEAELPTTCVGNRANVEEWGVWLFNAVLAGILIGLGGPFWYRVFSSLSQLTQALKAFGKRSGGDAEMMGGTRPGKPGKTDENIEEKAMTATVEDMISRLTDKAS